MSGLKKDATQGLVIAIVAGVAGLLLSLVRIWGDSGSGAFGGEVLDAALAQPIWGTRLAARLTGFAVSLLLAYVFFGIACWLLAQLSRWAWPDSRNSLRTWTALWLIVGFAWILVANATWFPWSSLGSPYASWASVEMLGIDALTVLTCAILLALGWLSISVIRRLARGRLPKALVWGSCAGVSLVAAVGLASMDTRHAAQPTAPGQPPHVILIGIDSLRPDYVGRESGSITPAIDAFVDDAAVFTDTITPLARTFPSWISILSGRHPHTTGAVINLLPRDLIDTGSTLPDLLRRAGYHTVYATDEVRFANIDESYGFDQTITPRMGAADFMVGFFGDTPLSNILANTRAGAALFPYTYANRAAATVYEPDTFVERLADELDFAEPTFLAIHFTLPHWPFTWSTAPLEMVSAKDVVPTYDQTVARVDRQFGDFIEVLRELGALDNALVVLLSDHGQSLGGPSAIADGSIAQLLPAESSVHGHGTNVFALDQYEVLLALRTFGETPFRTRAGDAYDVPASLEDIAPTVADALELLPDEPFDGRSLLSVLSGDPSASESMRHRFRFIETEFAPPGTSTGPFFESHAILQAAEYYQIDPETDRVVIRRNLLRGIMDSRQYAVLREGRLLAAVPFGDASGQLLVLREQDGTVRWLDEAPAAGSAEAKLWEELETRFASVGARPIVVPGTEP